jgi:diguanylate cyclase (GGDEF)-like protein
MPSSRPEDSPFRAGVLPETQVLLAGQDLLTGLSSRAGLEAHFRLAVARARRSGARFAVGIAAIGVDPTVPADEVFGHDLVVMEAAKRLRGTLRETDLIARLGETRFAFLAEEVTPEGSASLVARVLRTLKSSDREASGSARPQVGLALWEVPEQTLPALLREAERALTADATGSALMLSAANAETFGPEDDPGAAPVRTTAQRVARRAIGWLSLATLLALALSAASPEWRGRWLPLERFVQQSGTELRAQWPWSAPAAERRP